MTQQIFPAEDVFSGAVTLCSEPQLGLALPVSSDGVFKAIAKVSGIVPTPSVSDADKVIMVSPLGAYNLVELHGVPSHTVSDAGKILQVTANGTLAWVDPSTLNA